MNDVPPVWWNDGTTLIVKNFISHAHICVYTFTQESSSLYHHVSMHNYKIVFAIL